MTASGLLMAACTPQEVSHVATVIHARIYLPQRLPHGLRFMSAKQIGRRMAYIAYGGSGGRSLSLFESPDPIAQPSGAVPASGGLLVSVQASGTGQVTSVWLRRPGVYIQVMAAGIALTETETLARGLAPAAKP